MQIPTLPVNAAGVHLANSANNAVVPAAPTSEARQVADVRGVANVPDVPAVSGIRAVLQLPAAQVQEAKVPDAEVLDPQGSSPASFALQSLARPMTSTSMAMSTAMSTATAMAMAMVGMETISPARVIAERLGAHDRSGLERAAVRRDPRFVDPRLVLLVAPSSRRAAAFRLLCRNLHAKGLPRIVAVTSPAAHEGKTTCAINLALALAERPGSRTLLLDGNLFKPALAEIFGVAAFPTSLTSSAPRFPDLAPFELAEVTPCLHVAGLVARRGQRPTLEVHELAAILDRLWLFGYERVIIDAPALDGSLLVARLVNVADGVVVSVRAGRTKSPALRRAVESIMPGKGLGFALIDVE